MKAFIITDYQLAFFIVKNPVIADCITEDGCNGYIPDILNEFWIGIKTDKIIGCYRIESKGAILGQIHAFILPEYRKEYSIQASSTILEWAFGNISGLEKLICEVPAKYENVILHCLRMGFVEEGINRKSFLKDGKIYDKKLLGITKSEAERWFQQ